MMSDKLTMLRGKVNEACKRAKRDPQEIKIVLVTKQIDSKLIEEAYRLGVRDFGENRVQEWQDKKDALARDIDWHLIGHLQTNKTKYWVGETKLVHSLDSEHLALAIETEAGKRNIQVDCLLQVNISGEETKFGIAPQKLSELAKVVSNLSHIRIKGLMTIGPNTEDLKEIRGAFKKLRELSDEMKVKFSGQDWRYLSMGMSSDFEIAIEEGSNLIRIGTAVFGEREKK